MYFSNWAMEKMTGHYTQVSEEEGSFPFLFPFIFLPLAFSIGMLLKDLIHYPVLNHKRGMEFTMTTRTIMHNTSLCSGWLVTQTTITVVTILSVLQVHHQHAARHI